MKRALALAVVAAMVAVTVPVPVQAASRQATSGTINGKASDQRGQPLTVCALRLRNLASGSVVQTASTDSAGQFAFANVPLGDYIVEVVDSAGTLVATSSPVTLTSSGPAVTGVSVVSPKEVREGCVAAAVPPLPGAAGGGSFFTSTAGVVLLVAAGAGAGTAIYFAAREKASPSK